MVYPDWNETGFTLVAQVPGRPGDESAEAGTTSPGQDLRPRWNET
jgi:hypothetical protein